MIFGMKLYQMCWYFFLYSFCGWVLEVIFHAVSMGQIINRGFLNGPICPIYGVGVLSVFAMVNALKTRGIPMDDLGIFLFGLILATLVELIGGWLLDKCFHARWWDYSERPLNFHGYICLKFSLIWGIAILLVVRILQKHIADQSIFLRESHLGWVLIIVFSIAFFFDFIVTVAIIQGFNKRLNKLDELREEMRVVSDRLCEKIGKDSMAAAKKFEEERVQAALAKAEFKEIFSEKTAETAEELFHRQKALQRRFEELTSAMTAHSLYGSGRLLRAFPDLKHRRHSELVELLKGKMRKQ